MIMTICASNNRNAIVDGYVGLVNHFSAKSQVIAVIPGVCSREEFDGNLHRVIVEDFRDKGKITSKLLCLSFYMRLGRVVRQEGVEGIFIYSDSEWPNLIHLMIPALRKIKTTVYIHDPKHHSGEQGVIRFIRKFTYPYYAKHATCILSYEKAKAEIVENHPVFKDAKLVSVRLPGMPVMEFPDLRKAVEQRQVKIEYDLVFYGRLEAYKGIDLLLEANQYLHKSKRAAKILIIGGRGELKEWVKRGVENDRDVTFIDTYVSNRALAEFIVKAKAVILPYKDATGTQTIQIANYYYKPVIVNPVGCFDEYVVAGKNGFFIQEMTPEALGETIHSVLARMARLDYDPMDVRKVSDKLFDIDTIAGEIEAFIRA